MTGTVSFSTRRMEAGLSLDGVSTEFGVSPAVVREWEEGKVQPPSHVIRSLDLIRSFAPSPCPLERAAWAEASEARCDKSTSQTLRPPAERTATGKPSSANLIRSKQRVADHGEVFTPPWMVENMLDLVKGETERIDSRFLEPACGSGNFLVPILQRKLAAVEGKYGKGEFDKRHFGLLGLTCCYGIELLADNIAECRANMLDVFAQYLRLEEQDELYRAASHVLSLNLIHGDAMTMKDVNGGPITIVEWGYIGKGKFQRRDFRLDVLTGMSSFREERSLFSHLGSHEIFRPTESYPPMRVADLAAADVAA